MTIDTTESVEAKPEHDAYIRVYVSCLASRAQGHVVGQWVTIEPEMTPDDLLNKIKAIVIDEWSFHDSVGLGRLSEHESVENVIAIAEKIREHGDAFLAYLDYCGDMKYCLKSFEGRFITAFEDGGCMEEACANYMRELLSSTGVEEAMDKIPVNDISPFEYLDFPRIAEDAGVNTYNFLWKKGTLYVFYR